MSKDKLISLIIRKETYKDTKAYLTDLQNLKEEAVKSSFLAIKQILTTDYNAEAKLYAVRFLKDAFEKANPSFINQVQKDILQILINISVDENDEKAHMKYAGSSYTKSEQLSKFKAIVSSLFRMVKECIIKWAEWIPDPNRKFAQALNEITKKKVSLKFQWKYFRPQNQQIFKQNCQKHGIKITQAHSKPPVQKSAKKQVKDPFILAIEASLKKVETVTSQKQLLKVENDFNEAINDYLENSQNFKEELVQNAFDQFENMKREATNRIKSAAPQKSKESVEIASKEKSEKNMEETSQPSKQPIKSRQSPVQKPLSQKTQPKIQKPVPNTASKPQNREIVQRILNTQEPIYKLQSLKVKEQSQKVIRQAPKKVQQPIKTKIEEVKIPQTKISQAKVKSPRKLQQKIQNNIIQEVKKVEPPPSAAKQSKIPTSPKRGPIKFDEDQSPFSSHKPSVSAKEESRYASKQASHKKQSKQVKFDNSISKQESQRINFSDQDSSEFSQETAHKLQPRDFKKKSQLTPIRQQTQRAAPEQSGNKSTVMGGKSRLEEQSFTNRQKKGAATHKLMEDNRILMERYEKLVHEHEKQAQEKLSLLKEKQKLERQLYTKTDNEQKLIKKLKSSIPMQDYNRLRKELQQQRSKRQNLIRQNIKIRNENQSLIEQLNETKYRLKGNPQQEKSRQVVRQSHSNSLNYNLNQTMTKPAAHAPIIKQDIDEDYIKNVTHTSNLHNLLNKINLGLFKKNALSQSEIFYRDEYVSIMAKSRVYTQNNEQFVSISLTFQFKSLKQIKPQVKYKNCQQLDLWSKPMVGQEELYTQQLAVRLHSNPLKIIKAEGKIIQSIEIPFLLPILYLNFLRQEQFSNQEFDDIFTIKSEQLIKSKVTQWNSQIIKQAADIHKLFKYCIINGDKVRFCLSQGINDQIFMGQFEILRNNKFLLRLLPIPYTESMIGKAKELMENITFLIS